MLLVKIGTVTPLSLTCIFLQFAGTASAGYMFSVDESEPRG